MKGEKEVEELVSGYNSWNLVYNEFKNHPLFIESMNDVLREGNQSIPVAMILFINGLLECDCEPFRSCNKCKQ